MNRPDELKAAAEAAISELGGPTVVAKKLGISPWAVSKWCKSRIPAERVQVLANAFPNKGLKPHLLRPDIYPTPPV